MNRPRPSTPLRALLRPRGARVAVAALALAAPASALAAEPLAGDEQTRGQAASSPAGEGAARQSGTGPVVDPLQRQARAEAARAKRRRQQRPLHPIAGGSSHYGDAQAAFGNARGRPHEGQDMFAPAGTTVIAPADGIVVDGGSDGGRGNWVAIFDPKREQTYSYFHLLGPATAESGAEVKAGDKVGEVGCTGSCFGDHLHFELRGGRGPYGPATDPMPFLQGADAKRG